MVEALLLTGLIAALILLRQNLLVILGAAVLYVYGVYGEDPLRFVVLDAWHALNKDILLSLPLFILAGQVMSRGAMAQRLVRLVKAASSPIPGGLAVATVLSCALFAAISGSSTVTLLAVGGIMYPALLREGYSKSFSLGTICAAGTLGIVVPPSIPLILYGVMTRTSIADLFIAGLLPALVLTLLMSGYALWFNRRMPAGELDWREVWEALKQGVWALFMPILILGGIYSGHFTATESAAVAVVYAFIVELCVHRELKLAHSPELIAGTTRVLGALFPVLMFAVSLNTFLTYQQVPMAAVDWFSGHVVDQRSFLLGANLFLLLVGAVMDIGSAVLILAPLLEPMARSLAMDPVHFGIVMIVNLEIGYLTPPFGLNLIIAMGAFKTSFLETCKSVLPFLGLMLVGLLLVSLLPALSLLLVR